MCVRLNSVFRVEAWASTLYYFTLSRTASSKAHTISRLILTLLWLMVGS